MSEAGPYIMTSEADFDKHRKKQLAKVLLALSEEGAYDRLAGNLNDLHNALERFLSELVISRPQHKRADRIQHLLKEIQGKLVPEQV